MRTNAKGDLIWANKALSGYEIYNGIKHYFYLEFDQDPLSVSSLDWEKICAKSISFDSSVKEIKVRYGISYISVEQARKNLREEIADFDLDRVAGQAKQEWNKALSKIVIDGGTEDQKTVFYTSLYRAHERMINISEDGKYFSGYDGKVHEDGGVDFWVDDWVWDTYLALHPLQVLLNPKAQNRSFPPTFACMSNRAGCQLSHVCLATLIA